MLKSTRFQSEYKTSRGQALWSALVGLCVLLGTLAMGQGQVMAQDQPLLIVPFDQEGVDQTFYAKLMEQVSKDANRSQSYEVLDAPVSGKIEDILFEVGCPDLSNECLQLLGETYGAESIMWGKIWKNDRVTLLEIKLFDVLAGGYTIDPPIERSFETDNAEQLRDSIIGEFQQIFFPYTGEITVTASEPSADIFFDGEKVGNTSTGPVVLTGRPLGEHIIRAIVGDKEVKETVVLLFDTPNKLEIDMSKADLGPNGGGFRYTGTVVSGSIGGVFLASGMLFAILTNGESSAATEESKKLKLGEEGFDPTKANDILNNGSSYETFQFISFGIGAAALVTAGVFYFFESADDNSSAVEGATTWWAPMMIPNGAGATVGGRF